jgi:RimJ/RimL family protein N-acetyltransferase
MIARQNSSGSRPFVRLETQNYVVRTLEPPDVNDKWLRWMADPEIMNPINLRTRNMTRQELEDYIFTFDNREEWLFGIFDKNTGGHIGNFEIRVQVWHRRASFNALVGEKQYWGRNVVLEARAVLLDYFFENVGVEKAFGLPFVRNFSMMFNYLAQGWKLEGILKGHCRSILNDQRLDQYQFGLLRSEWRARRQEHGA